MIQEAEVGDPVACEAALQLTAQAKTRSDVDAEAPEETTANKHAIPGLAEATESAPQLTAQLETRSVDDAEGPEEAI